MKTFTQLAREALEGLVTEEGALREFRRCRDEEHVVINQNEIEIDLGYEPFGPPWCFVDDGTGSRTRIGNRKSMSPNGTLEQTHQDQLMEWLWEVRAQIEACLNKTKAQQGGGGQPATRPESK